MPDAIMMYMIPSVNGWNLERRTGMRDFMGEDVLLGSATARELYENVKALPIYDYHCHLSPREIYEDKRFDNIGRLWLAGDHYKWRLMRAGGIEEEYITGNASWEEKFYAFAKILPKAAGNPIYHWVHRELNTYFGIREPLNAQTAPAIWQKTTAMMAAGGFTPRAFIQRSNVEVICTTDDPVDSLEYHKALAEEGYPVKVRPTFRPDKAVCGLLQEDFAAYAGSIIGREGDMSFTGWLSALSSRLDFFCAHGCRISDISLGKLPAKTGTYDQAAAAFGMSLAGQSISNALEDAYMDYMLRFLAIEYHKRSMVMQLHLSALRNNSTQLHRLASADCGNDSIGPAVQVTSLGRMLNEMERAGGLPKMIVYTLNPSNYYELATMLGNFQGGAKGGLLLGAAWWFCDHAEGIREHLKILAATGLIGSFTGMLTDSRSFTSYVRHDYFRRILCDYIGSLVERGEYDRQAAEALVKAVSVENARDYFTI